MDERSAAKDVIGIANHVVLPGDGQGLITRTSDVMSLHTTEAVGGGRRGDAHDLRRLVTMETGERVIEGCSIASATVAP
jgi:hypothetical protein